MVNLDDLDDDIILCNICNNEYDENERSPKLLPCLQTLCKDCALNSMRGATLKCSLCNEEHQLSNDLELLKDSTMCNMMDMIKIQRKSSSIKCFDCPDDNRGEQFCKDCYTFLCKECTNAHKRTQITRRHVVLSIEEFKSSGIENFSRKELCCIPGHEDQSYSFYCSDCQRSVCTQCIVGDHCQAKGHDIRNLGEIYDENKHAVERKIGELLNKIADISSNAKSLESESTLIEKTQADIVSEIDKVFLNLEKLVKERKEKLKQRVDVICQQRKADVIGQLDLLQKAKSQMENCCNYSSRMLVFTNKPEFIQIKPTVLTKLQELVQSDNITRSLEPVEISFNAGPDEARLEDFVNNIGEITTNIYGEMTDKEKLNGQIEENLELKLPYRGPPLNPPGKYTTNKFPNMRPTKLSKPIGARVEPLKLDGITGNNVNKPNRGVKMSPTEENTLGRPLSLKSPVITPSKQPTSLGDFLKSQESSEGDDKERQLPKTPTAVPSTIVLTKKAPISPISPSFTAALQSKLQTKASPTSPKFPTGSSTVNGGVSPTSPPFVQNYKNEMSSMRSPDNEKSSDSAYIASSIRKTTGSIVNQTNKVVTWAQTFNGQNTQVSTKPHTLVLTESSYPEVKQSTPSPRKTTPDKPVTFADIVCPDFQMDVATAHHEREVSTDGRILRNKKTDIYSGGSQVDIENSLVQYKGAIGTHPFQDYGRFYYEVDVVYNIQQPLEETWLVFEIGICRLDDVDMHHTVERHEFARSFYVARYPEDGRLTQEFWHNRDLLHFQSLSDNCAGLEVRVTYGFLVDTKRKTWTVVDCNNNKVLYNFDLLDFTEALYPVFGCYNPDLITVEMTLKTGTDITIIPQCLKTGYNKT